MTHTHTYTHIQTGLFYWKGVNTCDHISKHLFDAFPIQNGLKQGGALSPLLSIFSLEYAIRMVQENRVIGIEWNTSTSGRC
jgi:hypothetical protein